MGPRHPVSSVSLQHTATHWYNLYYICIYITMSWAICIQMYTDSYRCIQVYTGVYRCIQMCIDDIDVYRCIHITISWVSQNDYTVRIWEIMSYTEVLSTPRTATQCNTLQHTATHCNTLQQRGAVEKVSSVSLYGVTISFLFVERDMQLKASYPSRDASNSLNSASLVLVFSISL